MLEECRMTKKLVSRVNSDELTIYSIKDREAGVCRNSKPQKN